jgi:type I restriction enzyme R subunit
LHAQLDVHLGYTPFGQIPPVLAQNPGDGIFGGSGLHPLEDTFAKLMDLANGLDAEQRRAVEEGLSEDQLALFDLVQRADLTKTDRERIKQASRELLAGVLAVIAPLDRWTEKEQTQAEVETYILDHVYQTLPEPPYTPDDKAQVAQLVYRHIWQQSVRDQMARGS